jgi:hypothetical protein
MPTFIVTLAPATGTDALRLKINQALMDNLEFAFPDYSFQFVSDGAPAKQFTVRVSPASDIKPAPEQLEEVQIAVDRIATAMLAPR